MATQRKPTTRSDTRGANGTAPSPTKEDASIPLTTPPPQTSPSLPTPLETLLLAIYPSTLILGSLFSFLSPTISRSLPSYSPYHQSYHPASAAPSYFAQKRNVFNTLFVKRGWAWATLALALFAVTHPSLGPPLRFAVVTRRRAQLTARWALATAFWILVTQWCFGPGLVDRSFRWSGGACEMLADPDVRAEMSKTTEFFTARACKVAGGRWTGGHDISGHVFLLILGSAVLWMEVLPAVLRATGLREARRVRVASGKIVTTRSIVEGTKSFPVGVDIDAATTRAGAGAEEYTTLGVKVIVGIVALMWWMLLMTAAFFHTWFEKFTGFLVAFAALWVIYFLPRAVPQIRAVVGMPGL